jgi:hypothetical protein
LSFAENLQNKKSQSNTMRKSMSTSTPIPNVSIPTLLQSELMAAAHALGRAHQLFVAAAPGASGPTRNLLTSVADWFDVMLPAATGEIKKALVELCVMEIARAHLEHEADAGNLDSAKIIDVKSLPVPTEKNEQPTATKTKRGKPAAAKSSLKRDRK